MKINPSTMATVSSKASEVMALKSLFTTLDKDKDHQLSLPEFKEFAKSLGLNGDDLFAKLDKHKRGKISFNDFERGLSAINTEVFKKLDQNHDGSIDTKELEAFAKQFHFDPKKLTSLFDPHKTGKIKLEVFLKNFNKVLLDPGSLSTLHQDPASAQKNSKASAARLRQHLLPNDDQNKIDFFW